MTNDPLNRDFDIQIYTETWTWRQRLNMIKAATFKQRLSITVAKEEKWELIKLWLSEKV